MLVGIDGAGVRHYDQGEDKPLLALKRGRLVETERDRPGAEFAAGLIRAILAQRGEGVAPLHIEGILPANARPCGFAAMPQGYESE